VTLRREDHPCWVATCDWCGEGDNDEYGGSYHHFTEEEARRQLTMADWRQLEDGTWLCSTHCYDEAKAAPRKPDEAPQ
jgi:hypothetical protein